MENRKIEEILESWLTYESLNTGAFKKENHHIHIDRDTDFQFTDEELEKQAKITEDYRKKHTRKKPDPLYFNHRIYAGVYHQSEMLERLNQLWNTEEEVFDKQLGKNILFTFQLDSDGIPIEDSLFVPTSAVVMRDLFAEKWNGDLTHNRLAENKNSISEKLSESMEPFMDSGFNGVTFHEWLAKVLKELFYVEENIALEKYIRRNIPDKLDNEVHFNSFLYPDLEFVISQKDRGLLPEYLSGKPDAVDVNENRAEIEKTLSPENIPLGRWPSNIEFQQSLMQQFAINKILNEEVDILSVNGPPGTGKTSLLKDVFADLVVQRAIKMTGYKHPTDAFIKINDKAKHKYPYYLMDENLQGYSMAVASSNNGAVENLTKDLPDIKEIDSSELDKVKDADIFPRFAHYLLHPETNIEQSSVWGLFSLPLGKNDNINKAVNLLFNGEEKFRIDEIANELETIKTNINWQQQVEAFNDCKNKVEEEINRLINFKNKFEKFKNRNNVLEEINETDERINSLNEEENNLSETLEDLKVIIENKEQKSLLDKLLFRDNKAADERSQRQQTKQRLEEVKSDIKSAQKELDVLKQEESEYKEYHEEKNDLESDGLVLPADTFFNDEKNDYQNRQKQCLWMTTRLMQLRSDFFIEALKLHHAFNACSHNEIKAALASIAYRKDIDLNSRVDKERLIHSWKTLHLLIPVVSTTFSSLGSMYRGLGAGSLDYLFVDEAGQAMAHQAAGGLLRSRKFIAVGDPLQIEPVMPLSESLINAIRQSYNLDDQLGNGYSVQYMADKINRYGTELNDGTWIGIPLWVHRRCLDPMFSISNKISYENRMVHGFESGKSVGSGFWIHSKGTATEKQYVPEHAEETANLLGELLAQGEKLNEIFIITPFTAVKNNLKTHLRKSFKETKGMGTFIESNIGTVHTFQGKGADTVIFVAGTDESTNGATQWSCSKSNLLNVAVTRAKKTFYIIGDEERLSRHAYYSDISQHTEPYATNRLL